VTSGGGGSLQSLSYAYDNVGNVTAITDNRDSANNQTFTYDSLNRLQTATGPYGTQGYTYSAIGNILTKAGVTYTYGATGQTCNRLMPHAVTSTSTGRAAGERSAISRQLSALDDRRERLPRGSAAMLPRGEPQVSVGFLPRGESQVSVGFLPRGEPGIRAVAPSKPQAIRG
jgi:YD repeat-containing protein